MAFPVPEPGLVISYAHLWHRERGEKKTEGVKDRPCVIVLKIERQNEMVVVTVSPITHRQPSSETPALELPQSVKRHLGYDSEKSWIVLDEINQFAWPGFDLRPIRGRNGRIDYSYLPPKLFERVAAGIRDVWRRSRGKSVRRD
ncbi:MAG: type II toxin-antitoxin system PemK/MazF family toxin [Alphaproteobacteria bacterium]|nr:type II toxin-antitoxin system PemK/MazF family toxin [Alphaproteobacteria bacterium]MDE2110355.1 type II toxin-antitoxin system PemK/MazF family toxin [Alphaproteobacteria bacterium]MDE2495217.1 type II toxin-antitoxin system PemK/MazF family toxin [Alphaproteobacteria bacterium]